MKKTLGILALIGSAAALVAYKLKKDEKIEHDYKEENEEDVSEKILRSAKEQNFQNEDFEEKAVVKTTTYPHLNEEDITYLNEISKIPFKNIEDDKDDERQERPLQHIITFEDEVTLENYKNTVINDGYVVTNGNDEKELIVLNITSVDADVILGKVFHLADLAKEHHGKYCSWNLK